jgi:site-specific DNA-methyltransferase (cytosine-N4-specific)
MLRKIVTENWDFPDSNGGTGLFNLHSYPAKFIPQIPKKVIECLEIPKDTLIFDPFCGSGTSLIVAQNMGYETIGVDINPIATLISKVATSILPKNFSIAYKVLETNYKKMKIKTLPEIPNLDHWFDKNIQFEIEKIYQSIMREHNKNIRNLFFLALSSIIVKISKQESDTRYASIKKNITSADVYPLFFDVLMTYKNVLSNKLIPKSTVITSDSLSVPSSIFYKKVGLTITSPPYPNAYEYWLYHKYRMYWLRYDPIYVKSREIGTRHLYFKKEPERIDTFKKCISKIFLLLSEITSNDGFACFIVGDSKIHGNIVDNSEMVIQAARENNFSEFAFIQRKINQNRKSFNLKNSRAKNEDVLVFRKGKKAEKKILFYFNDYNLFSYEKIFAARELSSLQGIQSIDARKKDFIEIGYIGNHYSKFYDLTYFKSIKYNTKIECTKQYFIEKYQNQRKTQNTRYGVHGLHEYKGKFNPQVVKSILNSYSISNKKILDPFCGSGTSLIEGAFLSNQSIGFDINPFAVFLSNVKINALNISLANVDKVLKRILNQVKHYKKYDIINDERDKYLSVWFPHETKVFIETFYKLINNEEKKERDFLLLCMSNILRDYSYQEPSDLRIRKRISPFPSMCIKDAFKEEVKKNLDKIKIVQDMNYSYNLQSYAILEDVRLKNFTVKYEKDLFDFFVTSPPYATALPYIDTQRLSSVWLNLIDANNIRYYERLLIGTRELTKIQLNKNFEKLHTDNILPKEIIDFCLYLEKNLSKNDGFRRQAIPYLLYNYFYDMYISLENLHYILKKKGYFCLILGKNRTRIGGKETIIDTPYFLSLISQKVGYSFQELIPLETYQRYDIHLKNSIDQESLIVLQKK